MGGAAVEAGGQDLHETRRQTDRQTDSQTVRQMDRQRQTVRQIDRQRQTVRQIDRQQTDRQTDKDRQSDRQTDRQTKKTDRQTKKTDRQTDRQTDRVYSSLIARHMTFSVTWKPLQQTLFTSINATVLRLVYLNICSRYNVFPKAGYNPLHLNVHTLSACNCCSVCEDMPYTT